MRNAQPLPRLAENVEVTAHRGDLAALAASWQELVDPDHPGAAFRSWAWISAWWKSFSVGRQPFVLVARDGGAPIGLLPLCAERSPLGGRRLVLMGEGIVGSDYLGIVGRAADQERLACAFARQLAQESYDELDLDGILRGDPLLRALARVIPASRSAVELRYRCPHIELKADFAHYLAGLPDGTGAAVRAAPALAREAARLSRSSASAIPTQSSSGSTHSSSCTASAGQPTAAPTPSTASGSSSSIASPPARWPSAAGRGCGSCTSMARRAPRSYGFRHGNRFAFYQAGYDPEWRQRSVGTVLLGEIVRQLYDEGVGEYDFLRGTETYKLRWANGWRETVRLRARDASLRARIHGAGRTVYWRLREAGKRALPASALAWARRARRKVSR